MLVVRNRRTSRRIRVRSRRRFSVGRRVFSPTPTSRGLSSMMTFRKSPVRIRPSSPRSLTPQYGSMVVQKRTGSPSRQSQSPVPKHGIGPRLMKHVNIISKQYQSSLWPNISRFHLQRDANNANSSTTTFRTSANEFVLPTELTNAFTISMRPHIMAQLFQRLGPWSSIVKHWPATDGRQINPQRWYNMGYLVKRNRLTRGQMGCFDAHASLWQHIVEHGLPWTLIMEDDPEFHYSEDTSRRLIQIFDEIRQHGIKVDLMYLGSNTRNRAANTRHRVSNSLTKPTGCVGLFCYVVTLEGARKLLQRCRPYTVPVDIYTINEANAGRIAHVHANPCFGFVFSRSSDTRNIK